MHGPALTGADLDMVLDVRLEVEQDPRRLGRPLPLDMPLEDV
jgi:hypothetical protein